MFVIIDNRHVHHNHKIIIIVICAVLSVYRYKNDHILKYQVFLNNFGGCVN